MATSTKNDFTMELLPGSVVFSVQDTLFRIPNALLQQHSETLAGMLDLSKPEDKPIELDDPLEAFCDFRSMLLTPLDSCLIPSHPTSKCLDRLLELLVLCNKYVARKLEEHVASLVEPLVQANTLQSNLDANPTMTLFDVLRAGSIVNRPEIGTAAHDLLIDRLWRDVCLPYEVLVFAESINDKKLIGTAYYRIMVRRDLKDLNPSQRQILDRGMIRCGEEWQRIFDLWGEGKSLSGAKWECRRHYTCEGGRWLHEVWSALSKAKIPWYDVVGKVMSCSSSKETFSTSCDPSRETTMKQELARVKGEVYRHFVD